MPCEGSVGASGDLTPLSYLAAVLVGEREVRFRGQERGASEVLAELGMAPLRLGPKEALGLMNGTSVSTALVGKLGPPPAALAARLEDEPLDVTPASPSSASRSLR